MFWCLVPRFSSHRKFYSLESPACPWVPYCVLQPTAFLSRALHSPPSPLPQGSQPPLHQPSGAFSSSKEGWPRVPRGWQSTQNALPHPSPLCLQDAVLTTPTSSGPCPHQSALQWPHEMGTSQGQRVHTSGSGPGTSLMGTRLTLAE